MCKQSTKRNQKGEDGMEKYYMIACNSVVERNSNPIIKVQKQETLKIK